MVKRQIGRKALPPESYSPKKRVSSSSAELSQFLRRCVFMALLWSFVRSVFISYPLSVFYCNIFQKDPKQFAHEKNKNPTLDGVESFLYWLVFIFSKFTNVSLQQRAGRFIWAHSMVQGIWVLIPNQNMTPGDLAQEKTKVFLSSQAGLSIRFTSSSAVKVHGKYNSGSLSTGSPLLEFLDPLHQRRLKSPSAMLWPVFWV